MLKPVYEAVIRTGSVPVLIFLVTFGMTLFETARVPILEEAVCRSLAVDDCRHDRTAQARLASINGWIDFATAVQGILLVLPYAWLAEQMNKHQLLLIGFTTSILSMAYFLVITRAGSTALCGVLLDGFATAIIPVAISIYAISIAIMARSCIHCAQKRGRRDYADGSCQGLLDDNNENDEDANNNNGGSIRLAKQTRYTKAMFPLAAYKEMIGQGVIAWGLLFYFFKVVAVDTQFIQTQWVVRRFAWNFSAAAYIYAYTALFCLLVLAGLPFLSSYLIRRYNGNTQRMEITILRLSIASHAIGSLAMGLAPSRALYIAAVSFSALSVGAIDTFKSFLSGFCSPDQITELYATFSLVETATHVVASRMWTAILIASFDLNGIAMGLPFLVSAGISAIAFCLIWSMARYTKPMSSYALIHTI
ncbi:uncharacterized protein TRIVIDRAFT_218655 [Trichoderma virens Gv29-8]|uniref:MFS transporter n=1 Tax=Hypocrea virens (strain Gv29-8 / FGSC 10586) TaxID=413071 RepID=G9MG51_HYPVG|nr:uncharacterized protein TRIVIDRAFT_218655 [Trichoderma virens Gv29-8]EHK26501.1 hypothetical protein TRIVIDRAFT_218655 [Trichoderma virens Gv29-8]